MQEINFLILHNNDIGMPGNTDIDLYCIVPSSMNESANLVLWNKERWSTRPHTIFAKAVPAEENHGSTSVRRNRSCYEKQMPVTKSILVLLQYKPSIVGIGILK